MLHEWGKGHGCSRLWGLHCYMSHKDSPGGCRLRGKHGTARQAALMQTWFQDSPCSTSSTTSRGATCRPSSGTQTGPGSKLINSCIAIFDNSGDKS